MCSLYNEGRRPSFSHDKTRGHFHDDLKVVFQLCYLQFLHDMLDCGCQCDCLPISAAITGYELYLWVVAVSDGSLAWWLLLQHTTLLG